MASIILKKGREKSLLRRHPWLFSGAVQRIEGTPRSGETVELVAAGGDFLARAAYSPQSQIRARVWTFAVDEAVDADFFRKRIRAALAARSALGLEAVTDSCRLIHGESDGLPGLVVDRYGQALILQALTTGAEYWKGLIVELLVAETGAAVIYERSDAEVRQLEGLPFAVGLLHGELPPQLFAGENGLTFQVDVAGGQKTGFFLDQRDNRLRVRQLAHGREVLDCFCFTGGFSVNALAGGAKSVLALDISAEALARVRSNAAMNGLELARLEDCQGDVFKMLRKFRDQGRSFDLIILDPPKFAPTTAQVEKAARGYKDINLLAFKLLKPGGFLFTFSCSGGVDAGLFQKIVAGAALDAGINARIVGTLTQGGDHPVLLSFPEGAYLKGLICLRD
ncbi:class I SAM-dependent rRNA methyltransferase [Thiovibrio sp. JS02]